jgi:hypothetical protein
LCSLPHASIPPQLLQIDGAFDSPAHTLKNSDHEL